MENPPQPLSFMNDEHRMSAFTMFYHLVEYFVIRDMNYVLYSHQQLSHYYTGLYYTEGENADIHTRIHAQIQQVPFDSPSAHIITTHVSYRSKMNSRLIMPQHVHSRIMLTIMIITHASGWELDIQSYGDPRYGNPSRQ